MAPSAPQTPNPLAMGGVDLGNTQQPLEGHTIRGYWEQMTSRLLEEKADVRRVARADGVRLQRAEIAA